MRPDPLMTALYGARDELNPLLTWFRFTETSAGLREIGISASVLYMYAQIIKAERMNEMAQQSWILWTFWKHLTEHSIFLFCCLAPCNRCAFYSQSVIYYSCLLRWQGVDCFVLMLSVCSQSTLSKKTYDPPSKYPLSVATMQSEN